MAVLICNLSLLVAYNLIFLFAFTIVVFFLWVYT